MINDLKPYAEYKESGLPWLGQVPGHWGISRIKTVLRETDRRSEDGAGTLLSLTRARGLIPRKDMTDKMHSAKTLAGYKRYRAGQLVMNRMQAWSGMFGADECDGLVSPDYAVFDVLGGHDIKLVLERLKTPDMVGQFALESKGIGSGFNRLYTDRFGPIPISLPPPDEQAAIVRFLDWANGRLERAIRAKRKVIALLNEQKQAIIHRAVTRGLDPSVPLKPSGIPWLGDIPQHWEVRKIRAVATRVTKGTTPTTLGKQFVDAGIRFLKVESISADRGILESKCAFIDDATDRLLSRSRLHAHDVVVSIAGAVGRPAIIAPSLLPANTNQAVGIISLIKHLCRPEWLTYILASPMCLRAMTDSSVQSAQANLSLASLGRTAIALPPVHEQDLILASLSSETASVSNAVSRLEREIELLREYRTRLVADVVTGKLDVREAAAQLPDEAPLDSAPYDLDLDDDAETADEQAAL